MGEWHYYEPADGWPIFAANPALTAAVWAQFVLTEWNYLNLHSDSSIWESRHDGSIGRVHYEGDRLVEFAAQSGTARDAIAPLVAEFQLLPVAPP